MKKFSDSKSRLLAAAGILFAIMMISSSCSKKSMDYVTGTGGGTGTVTGPGANEVWIQGMAFNPSTLSVPVGTTVKWTNKDAVSHDVTSNPALFASSLLGTGQSFSYKFDNAGTFNYICSIHPTMTASVTVY